MNCRYCGTRLPAGAMFCGECGRSVSASAAPAAPAPLLPPRVGSATASGNATVQLVAPQTFLHCPQCGAPMRPEDIFCGECGFVARSVIPPRPEAPPIRAEAEPAEPQPAEVQPTEELSPLTASSGSRVTPPGERFVLQFSTGESVTVYGTGLVGRNPSPEPGEFVDELIAILDVGKSVSKTHLEFGQEDGRFWVSDRYSTNGTVLRPHGADPRRCEPEHRYVVDRGSRVDIGDEFFVVS